MARYQNHVVDPTYFYDAIEEFAFDFDIFVLSSKTIDDYGNVTPSYTKREIRGSLQSQGLTQRQSKSGNTDELEYKFYCKSLYRINIGDIIEYKDKYLRVYHVQDYDEFGVREAALKMIDLVAYRDFADYIKYLRGEKLV